MRWATEPTSEWIARAADRLHRSGLSIGDVAFESADSVRTWIVSGRNEGAWIGMVHIAGQASRQKVSAFFFVSNRLDGHAPSTIEGVAGLIR